MSIILVCVTLLWASLLQALLSLLTLPETSKAVLQLLARTIACRTRLEAHHLFLLDNGIVDLLVNGITKFRNRALMDDYASNLLEVDPDYDVQWVTGLARELVGILGWPDLQSGGAHVLDISG